MGINKDQLLNLVIKPTLDKLGLGGESAENLLLGTCAQESEMGTYIAQINGPALGIYQMEPVTHNDCWVNFLMYNHDLSQKIKMISPRNTDALVYNLSYATAMTRIKYLRAPYALPDPKDIVGLANYYKAYYNSPQGKATIGQFIDNYKKYVA